MALTRRQPSFRWEGRPWSMSRGALKWTVMNWLHCRSYLKLLRMLFIALETLIMSREDGEEYVLGPPAASAEPGRAHRISGRDSGELCGWGTGSRPPVLGYKAARKVSKVSASLIAIWVPVG